MCIFICVHCYSSYAVRLPLPFSYCRRFFFCTLSPFLFFLPLGNELALVLVGWLAHCNSFVLFAAIVDYMVKFISQQFVLFLQHWLLSDALSHFLFHAPLYINCN